MSVTALGFYAAALAFGAVAFFFTHYLGHRIAHLRLKGWRVFFYAHVGDRSERGHHLIYLPSSYKTSRYRPVRWRNAIDVAMAIPWVILLRAVLPAPYFLVIAVEVVTLGVMFSYIHASTHLTEHWLNRFPLYRTVKAKHLMHHDDMRHNFGFGLDWFDRLFRTFKPLPRAE